MEKYPAGAAVSLRVLVVVHDDDAPVGLLGEEAERLNHRLNQVFARDFQESAALASRWAMSVEAALDHDALVILGGAMDSFDDLRYPHYRPLQLLIRAYVTAGRAVLGLCLGAQLIARAFGAVVSPMGFLEARCQPLMLLAAGRSDPLLWKLPRPLKPMQWHYDAFELPKNAVPLLMGTRCKNQAFFIEPGCWAFQAHFEASRQTCDRWDRTLREVAYSQDAKESRTFLDVEDALINGRVVMSRWLRQAVRLREAGNEDRETQQSL